MHEIMIKFAITAAIKRNIHILLSIVDA